MKKRELKRIKKALEKENMDQYEIKEQMENIQVI
jgi:hypothetical protein